MSPTVDTLQAHPISHPPSLGDSFVDFSAGQEGGEGGGGGRGGGERGRGLVEMHVSTGFGKLLLRCAYRSHLVKEAPVMLPLPPTCGTRSKYLLPLAIQRNLLF